MPEERKIKLGRAVAITAVAMTFTFVVTLLSAQQFYAKEFESESSIRARFPLLFEIDELAREDYLGDIPVKSINAMLAQGYATGLDDSYAYYLPKEQAELFFSNINGVTVGIGISVIEDGATGLPLVLEVYPGSPAEREGVLAGDIIVSADGSDITQIGYQAAILRLGDSGKEEIEMTVQRSGEKLNLVVQREQYNVQTVKYENIDGIGYIRIKEFGKGTHEEFEAALKALAAESAEAFIFDVRNNAGGELQAIREILDTLLPEGPIMHLNYKGETLTYDSDSQGIFQPYCVLINGNTYSAAELFAAAIKDYKTGIIVGERSFGKGKMQSAKLLSDGSAIAYTTATFDPPFSENFDGSGVSPDITVSYNYFGNMVEPESDLQLKKAIDILND